jgi:hypothetical protein
MGEMPAPTPRAALSESSEAADPANTAGLTAREGEAYGCRLREAGVDVTAVC